MTLNLLNYTAPPYAAYDCYNILDDEQWQQKQAWLSRLVLEAQADVMAFQEVFSAQALAEQCKALGYPYFLATPSELDDSAYIYLKPGLALASKYPLQQKALFADTHSQVFSRQPLLACIETPDLGPLKLYVLHLKSKRPILDEKLDLVSEIDEQIGRWQADQLRAKELRALSLDIKQKQQAMIVLGDFNDDVSQMEHVPFFENMNEQQGNPVWRLYDAYELAPKDSARCATHYYGAQSNVIDFIFLSAEFSPDCEAQVAEVKAYHCFNRHLTHADFSIDSQASDHAAVMVELSSLAI